jgi:hypothetical protein
MMVVGQVVGMGVVGFVGVVGVVVVVVAVVAVDSDSVAGTAFAPLLSI